MANQGRALMDHLGKTGVMRKIRRLVANHTSKNPVTADSSISTESLGLVDLARRLSQLRDPDLGSVVVATVNVPGKGIFLTEELRQFLLGQEESRLSCVTKSH